MQFILMKHLCTKILFSVTLMMLMLVSINCVAADSAEKMCECKCENLEPYSYKTAVALSAIPTFVGIATGIIFATQIDGRGGQIAGISTSLASGIIFPSFGFFYIGKLKRAFAGIGLRVLLTGLGTLFFYHVFPPLGVISWSTAAISIIVDIVAVKKRTIEKNHRLEKKVTVKFLPAILSHDINTGFGFLLNGTF